MHGFEAFRVNDHLLGEVEAISKTPVGQAANEVCLKLFESQVTTLCLPGTSDVDKKRLFLLVYMALSTHENSI